MARILSWAVMAWLFSLTFTVAAQDADSRPTLSPPPTTNTAPPVQYTPAVPQAGPVQYPRSTIQPGTNMPIIPPPPGFGPAIPGPYPQAPLAILPPSLTPQRPRVAGEHYVVPARIEFNDGTSLVGDIHSDSPLQCMALFGQTAIPFNQIKGMEWRSQTSDPGETERKATVVLINGDSLTVTNVITTILLKTTWGEAKTDVAQVRSIVMTNEKVKWADTPLGRALVPDDAK